MSEGGETPTCCACWRAARYRLRTGRAHALLCAAHFDELECFWQRQFGKLVASEEPEARSLTVNGR